MEFQVHCEYGHRIVCSGYQFFYDKENASGFCERQYEVCNVIFFFGAIIETIALQQGKPAYYKDLHPAIFLLKIVPMMRNLLCTFFLSLLACHSLIDACAWGDDLAHCESTQSCLELAQSDYNQLNDTHQNRKADDCHEEAGQCAHHCCGIHHVVEIAQTNYQLCKLVQITHGINPAYINLYKNPFLEPGFIPPSFS